MVKLKVEEWLKQLQENDKPGKVKSLRGSSVEVMVQNKVKWPHEYVLSPARNAFPIISYLSFSGWLAFATL